MIDVSLMNFFVVTVMAILGILLAKSVMGIWPVKGVSDAIFAV
jgi:hypothetical protein